MQNKVILGILLSFVLIASASAQIVLSDDFSSNPNTNGKWDITRNGASSNTAVWDSNNKELILTQSEFALGVTAFYDYELISKNWSAEFDFKVSDSKSKSSSGLGGDGIVFMFYKSMNYPHAVGQGETLGFRTWEENVKGYGIEFDNYKDFGNTYSVVQTDPSNAHISLIQDTPNNHLMSVDSSTVEDSQWHHAKIDFDNGHIKVTVDGNILINHVVGPFDYSYKGIGFSASTGDAANKHSIKLFKLTDNEVPVVPNATVQIISPTFQSYNTTNILVNISSTNSQQVTFSTTGITNQVYTSPTSITLPFGTHTLTAKATNSVGEATDLVTFTIVNPNNQTNQTNQTVPLAYINIISPTNQIYNTTSILVNISYANATQILFSTTGITNQTYTSPIYITLPFGNHTLTAYGLNSLGNVTTKTISFSIINNTIPGNQTNQTNGTTSTPHEDHHTQYTPYPTYEEYFGVSESKAPIGDYGNETISLSALKNKPFFDSTSKTMWFLLLLFLILVIILFVALIAARN